jgi:hypothetical protein
MVEALLFSILIAIIMGIWLILNKLSQIKKIRELSYEDCKYMKEILNFIARKDGFYN